MPSFTAVLSLLLPICADTSAGAALPVCAVAPETAQDRALEDLAALAAHACGVPVALMLLLDDGQLSLKAAHGVDARPMLHDLPMHAVAGASAALLEVTDARADSRFADHPLIAGPAGIAFYAGAPLIEDGGHRHGILCVLDTSARRLDAAQKNALTLLARQAVGLLQARRDQRAAAARERTLLHLIDAMPDGVVSCDANGVLGEFNRAAREWHGNVDPRALPSWQWSQHFNLFEADGVQVLPTDRIPLLRAWQGEPVREARIVIKAADQPPRTVLCNGEQLTAPDGTVTGAVAVMRDVTALQAAMAQLAEQSRTLTSVIDGTRAGSWVWNIRSGELRLNERWAEIIGYTLEELAPLSIETWQRLVHPDDRQRSDALHALHFDGQSAEYDCVCRVRHKAGHWVWVHDRGRVYEWDADGRPLWMAGAHLDVTAAREAELATIVTKRGLQSLIDASVDVAIIATDNVGLITLFNPGAEKLLGYASDEVTGRCTPERFHLATEMQERSEVLCRDSGQKLTGFDVFIHHAANGDDAIARQWTYVRNDGQHRQVRLSVSAMRDGDGVVTGFLGMATDITDQIEAQEAARIAAERFSGAFAAAAQGMALVSLDGRWLDVNDVLCGMFGYDRTQLLATDFQTLTHPDDLTADLDRLHELLAGTRSSYHIPKRYFSKEGRTIWARLSVSLVRDAHGQPLHFVSQIHDVTDQHLAEERLRNSEERLRVTLHSIGEAVITVDTLGVITYANPVAEALLLQPAAGIIGQALATVFAPHDEGGDAPAANPLTRMLAGAEADPHASSEIVLGRPDGSSLALTTSAARIRNEDGTDDGVVLVLRDVTEARAQASRVSYQASHDPLTDLANRREFERQMTHTLDDGHHPLQANALLFIDLDGFKAVNDSCGHAAGDALLQQVARVLRNTGRRNDLVARLGGDEFAVILRGCAGDVAQRVAGQLCTAVEQIHFEWAGQRRAISASIGVAAFHPGDTLPAVVSAADAACYAAKELGRNRVCLSPPRQSRSDCAPALEQVA